ncbi:hypothetical protein diail_3574 [Diaporthe ilicicola]|nr:hypothetical protein diail_3574 [Diaporthe ilicicola]
MSDATTLHVDAPDFNNDGRSSQLTRSSISRNSSISSSHKFLQGHGGGGGTDMEQQQHLQPEPSASDKDQQEQQCMGECPCITKVLLAYQDININLDGRAAVSGDAAYPYGHHHSASAGGQVRANKQGSPLVDQQQVPVETALHCIKSSLEICEALMDCQTCSSRSECIMLSICMCDTMVSRAEELVGAVDPIPFSSLSAPVTNLEYGTGNKARTLSLDSNQILGPTARAPQRKSGAPSGHARSGLRLGHWRLDNEDELQVIQSLLTARMSRLDGLTARMKRVAQQNDWPVHDARIGSIRKRLTAAMFMTKRRSFF